MIAGDNRTTFPATTPLPPGINAPWLPPRDPPPVVGEFTGQAGYFLAGPQDGISRIQPFPGTYQDVYGGSGTYDIPSIDLTDDEMLDWQNANLLLSPTYGHIVQHSPPSTIAQGNLPSPCAPKNGVSFPGFSSSISTLVSAGDTMGSHAEPVDSLPHPPGSITPPAAIGTPNAYPGQKTTISLEDYEELLKERPSTKLHHRDKDVCMVCKRAIARGTLRRHLQTHVPKTSWPPEWIAAKTCPRCRRTLARPDGLKRHLESNICDVALMQPSFM